MSKHRARWKDRPENGDFLAAQKFLELQFPTTVARRCIQQARRTPCLEQVAKDLLRASGLELVPADDAHVAADLKKIRKGKPLSPIILVQGNLSQGRPLVIADGYHRVCAACHADEDGPISAVLIKP